ncbi:MAG: phosphoadenosine phosphosulfate reductase, partial [Deltaproteobacteria bacterium]|nr:phosphoadenosine phosphosulfate reductase [Deltaproteobacteria bacterium]
KSVNFNGDTGTYARSRSGCYFCFYQQRIEWVWLYEQHADLFKQAMAYEKDGFTWSQRETLSELIQPERITQIKREHLERTAKKSKTKRQYLIDILDDSEGEGCNICFI